MPVTKVIAKKDLLPFFKIGDRLTIKPILYEADTLICNEIFGLFKNDQFIKIVKKGYNSRLLEDGMKIEKISDAIYASKGSYKDSVIQLENGDTYPSSLVRIYEDYFEKV